MAGLIAGLAMALVEMSHSAATGLGFWLPMKLVAAVAVGVDSILGGGGIVILGLVLHLSVSVCLGIIFSIVTRPIILGGSAFFAGLIYGAIVWVVMTYIVLPFLNHTMRERMDLMPAWWFYEHLTYGAFLSLTPALRRAFASEEERWAEERVIEAGLEPPGN